MTACILGCASRDGHPYPAPEGYLACDRCITRLRESLTEITERWRRIVPAHALLPPPAGHERRPPGYHSTPPGSVHVMALRDRRSHAVDRGDVRSPLEVLHWWASYIRRERQVSGPPVATVDTEAGTVGFHLDWLARECVALPTLAAELADVRAQLRAVTDDPPPPVIGRCTATAEDGARCYTPLRLPTHGGPVIRCPTCRAEYDGVELVGLYRENRGE
ncbi:MAG TPA: hypothetical protein VFW65_31945 [Pseudonocardiaceae bacterium]|nr:hypothetical protein [Pseudonocardiaceae bacterium]